MNAAQREGMFLKQADRSGQIFISEPRVIKSR